MNFYGLTLSDLENYFIGKGDNKAKAKILYKSIYRNEIPLESIEELSAKTKAYILEDFTFDLPEEIERLDDGETAKSLLRFSDGGKIETVVMRHSYGAGICVSTQIGCSMGCKFCQSGRLKFRRDLTAAEMTGQIIKMSEHDEIKHVSIMGTGEPLDNFDNVKMFIDIISDPYGLAFGGRNITLSTCGIVPQIYRLGEIKGKFNLAVSLHAPNDETRSEIMPINRRWGIKELIKAVSYFSEKYDRRVTFEYLLLDGVNDSAENAEELAELIKNINCYVNLIQYNPTDGEFRRSQNADVFFDILKKRGANAVFRREFGGGINAACGQLTAKYD